MTRNLPDKILEDAIAILQRPNAWRQLACAFANDDPYHATIDGDDTDGWCIHGAIAKAARELLGNTSDAESLEQGVMDRIKLYMGWENDHDVHSFNDAEHRSLDEVISMLTCVLRGKGTPAIA